MPFPSKRNRHSIQAPHKIDLLDLDQATSSYTNLIDRSQDILDSGECSSARATIGRKPLPGLLVPSTNGVQFSVRSDEKPLKLQHSLCQKISVAVFLTLLPIPFFLLWCLCLVSPWRHVHGSGNSSISATL